MEWNYLEVSIKSTPSKIPTYQRTTPAKGVKFNTTSSNNVVLATKKSHTTPLKPSSTTASLTTAPNTPSSSREAAIQAKIQSTAERIKKVASLKDKWAKEKERKMQSHREKRADGKLDDTNTSMF